MTIKGMLFSVSVGLIVLAALAGVSVFATARAVDTAVADGREANRIVGGIGDLRYKTVQYLLAGTPRTMGDWKGTARTNQQMLESARFSQERQRALVGEMSRQLGLIQILFDQVVADRALEAAKPDEARAARLAETVVRDQLLVTTQTYRDAALALTELTLRKISSAQRLAKILATIFVGLMAAAAATSTLLLGRWILRSLGRLQRGIAVVADGDLNYRARPGGRDEISQVARAFDAMTGRLQTTHDALLAANEEAESFSYSVSHDLRAPLRAIDGFSRVLLEEHAAQLDEQGREHLDRVRRAAQQMGALIDDLLQLSRIGRTELHREWVEMSVLARQVAAELVEVEPTRDVDFLISDGVIAEADPDLMRIVLANLLGNAWKFTSTREHARIEFGARHAGHELFVRDNGVGFDMAYAAQLYGAFQRLHRAEEFPGTGIGLATVQRIVHRHGGRIWAESEPDRGATFSFTLDGEDDAPGSLPRP